MFGTPFGFTSTDFSSNPKPCKEITQTLISLQLVWFPPHTTFRIYHHPKLNSNLPTQPRGNSKFLPVLCRGAPQQGLYDHLGSLAPPKLKWWMVWLGWFLVITSDLTPNTPKIYLYLHNQPEYLIGQKISADKTAKNLTCCRKFCPLKSLSAQKYLRRNVLSAENLNMSN